MNPQATLEKLKDIQSPHAISMWPNTTAWYVTFSLILLVIVWLFVRWLRKAMKHRRQKQALSILNTSVSLYSENPNSAISDISTLLRRIALAKFKRKDVASLKNTAWLIFLDEQLQTTEFSTGVGKVLATAPYQKTVDADIAALSNLVERWIKRVL